MFDTTPTRSPAPGRVSDYRRAKVLVLLGTRPETIKLAPVIHRLRERSLQTLVVSSGQHKQLLDPFLAEFNIEADISLDVMRRDQSPNDVCSRVLERLDKILISERPDLIIVQGDTTTALAGTLAGFNRRIPVGHVEAGLRSGNIMSPFPEEMNRRMISQAATFHFAATPNNRDNLVAERVPAENIFVTGNPVVDSVKNMLRNLRASSQIAQLIEATTGQKRLVLTTHRRESFETVMTENLEVIRDFVESREDVCLIFPVHPNPNVLRVARKIFNRRERIHLIDPVGYSDFLVIMKAAWLIVSDSGGVQEEAPSLGKPLLVLRENTERPEAADAGVAKLVGNCPRSLKQLLEENYRDETWIRSVRKIANPFGDGRAASRIVKIVEQSLTRAGVLALHRN